VSLSFLSGKPGWGEQGPPCLSPRSWPWQPGNATPVWGSPMGRVVALPVHLSQAGPGMEFSRGAGGGGATSPWTRSHISRRGKLRPEGRCGQSVSQLLTSKGADPGWGCPGCRDCGGCRGSARPDTGHQGTGCKEGGVTGGPEGGASRAGSPEVADTHSRVSAGMRSRSRRDFMARRPGWRADRRGADRPKDGGSAPGRDPHLRSRHVDADWARRAGSAETHRHGHCRGHCPLKIPNPPPTAHLGRRLLCPLRGSTPVMVTVIATSQGPCTLRAVAFQDGAKPGAGQVAGAGSRSGTAQWTLSSPWIPCPPPAPSSATGQGHPAWPLVPGCPALS
jgi:hypothetical protein